MKTLFISYFACQLLEYKIYLLKHKYTKSHLQVAVNPKNQTQHRYNRTLQNTNSILHSYEQDKNLMRKEIKFQRTAGGWLFIKKGK